MVGYISYFGIVHEGPHIILVGLHGDDEIPIYKMYSVGCGTDLLASPLHPSSRFIHICKVTELAAVEDLAVSPGLIALPSVPCRETKRSSYRTETELQV
jgi:hypothetical protein